MVRLLKCMLWVSLLAVVTGCSGSGSSSSTSRSSNMLMGGALQGAPLTLAGTITTLAGGSTAGFDLPVGITTDGRNLYVADSNNNKIKKVEIATGTVTTVAGSGDLGTVDTASGFPVRFNHPKGITTDGTCLYVTEPDSNSIRKVVIATGEVTTLPILSSPAGITTDGVNLFVTDPDNNTIRKIVISSGAVTVLAGTTGTPGSTNGTGTGATFNQPVGITTDGSNLYVNDFGSGNIRKVVIADGAVSTVASGFTNPATGITTDGTNLYVADYFNNTISTFIISGGAFTQVPGTDMVFNHPEGITTDGKSLFIADSGNNTIRRLD